MRTKYFLYFVLFLFYCKDAACLESKTKKQNCSNVDDILMKFGDCDKNGMQFTLESIIKFRNPDFNSNNYKSGEQQCNTLHSKILEPSNNYDDFISSLLLSSESFENHSCRRECQPGKSLTCYYKFIVHNYQRLGPECQRCQSDVDACEREHCIFGDGVPTPLMVVNRMIPGPPIDVCQFDTIIVDVINYLLEPTTIHWHGLLQFQTPEMDGTPYLTQYPIQPGDQYRYNYEVDRSGTVWWHSHVGWQRGLGVAGSFVIRQPRVNNRQAALYDYDLSIHTLIIQDVFYNHDTKKIRNILINAKGRNHRSSLPDYDPRNRYEQVSVTSGYRYRIRVISNGINFCPIEFSIENHKMLIISTDGNDIEPVLADRFFMSSAERFDFVLVANQSVANYWIRVLGYGDCRQLKLYQGAVLHYKGFIGNQYPLRNIFENNANDSHNANMEIVIVNSTPGHGEELQNEVKQKVKDISITSLRSLTPLPWLPSTKFLTYYSSFGGGDLTNGEPIYQIDDITYKEPKVSLLQAESLINGNAYLCNRTSLQAAGRDCIQENCVCTNVIRLPAYKPIELVIVGFGLEIHPIHIHGTTYRVVGQGVLGPFSNLSVVEELDRKGVLKRSPSDFPAVQKDTTQLPSAGYVIFRFLSNNPGYWFYHCHIEAHAISGMAAILKIGEQSQMKRTATKWRRCVSDLT